MSSTSGPKPLRAIYTESDLNEFKKSQSYQDLVQFVRVCSDLVEGKNNSEASECSTVISLLNAYLEDLLVWVDEIPPIQQPMRFGNKAFRDFHARLLERTPPFVDSLLGIGSTDIRTYNEELTSYLCDSFGNPLRIDYGTGHETNFAIFGLCLFKLRLLKEADLRTFVLESFTRYVQVMRKLQSVYFLEPAGSHGVWGLDDYHCLIFVWGSSQLVGHPDICPRDVHDAMLVQSEAPDYMYLEGIQTILRIKNTAPFHETSPLLHSISELGDWKSVKNGMHKLYLGEVLHKLPVVQHVVFGRLFPASWTPSVNASPVEGGPSINPPPCRTNLQPGGIPNIPLPMADTPAPWAKK